MASVHRSLLGDTLSEMKSLVVISCGHIEAPTKGTTEKIWVGTKKADGCIGLVLDRTMGPASGDLGQESMMHLAL